MAKRKPAANLNNRAAPSQPEAKPPTRAQLGKVMRGFKPLSLGSQAGTSGDDVPDMTYAVGPPQDAAQANQEGVPQVSPNVRFVEPTGSAAGSGAAGAMSGDEQLQVIREMRDMLSQILDVVRGD